MTDILPFSAGKRMDDVTLLSRSSIVGNLGVRDLGVFLDTLDQVALPAGTTIFQQGEEGEHLYFLLEGRVALRRGSIEAAQLTPGAYLGELAVLGVGRRNMTAFAETAVRLARLARSRFLSLAATHPRVALRVVEALAASLAATVTSMTDDVGLLLQQRTLPRRSSVRITYSGSIVDTAMGTLASAVLPPTADGALVVAACLDHKAVSLETPLTSDAKLEPITVASWEGRRVFRSSVGLLLLEAGRRVLPNVPIFLGPRRGEAQVVSCAQGAVTAEIAYRIGQEMRALAASATPLREEVWAVDEARARFLEQGWVEAAALLPFHRDKTQSLVTCGGTFAIALGPVMPNARDLRGFELFVRNGELLLDFGPILRPHASVPTSAIPLVPTGATPLAPPVAEVATSPTARGHRDQMTRDLSHWLRTLGVVSVGQFDRSCVAGQVAEIIRVSEGFHEKNIGRIADRIAANRSLRIVAVAGPSSSGKTTFLKRLKVQLEVVGITPVQLSLDDYYVDRVRTPKDESGEYDFESASAIDIALFQAHAMRLLAGERVRAARFDFRSGTSLPEGGEELTLAENSVLLVEGLHALSPAIFGGMIAHEAMFRIFVHPATALPFDRLTAVLPEDLRLLRRIVRDRHQRGYLASESIRRWPSVRRGEERHVFSCIDQADVVFDSSLVYELAVLRVYAERYLLEISDDDPVYATAYRLRQLIDRFVPIHPDHVPPTSILREFIGGSGFDI